MIKTSSFDYHLPPERIAQTPIEPRDASRLMVVDRSSGQIDHRIFRNIGEYLRGGDLLVLNQTRVVPARLHGRKAETGGKVEILLLKQLDDRTWETLTRGKRLRPGVQIALGAPDSPRDGLIAATIVDETEAGGRLVRFDQPLDFVLEELGEIPLPPYIHEPLADPERYQTVYGRQEGSVAASTAGLHFTPELLLDLRRRGIELAFITLHIGLDTFRPVKEEWVQDHQIHTEWYELTAPVANQINNAVLEGRRVVAVGTTVVRALEASSQGGVGLSPDACAPPTLSLGPSEEVVEGQTCAWRTVSAFSGSTDLFIYPGYQFLAVQAMVTNFHLPRSTLLMLVSAFSSQNLIMRAYQEAILEGYRFFSFGDAMLLL
jgi:S-adenosylmethionine:tRNA ribosyltransferase-isomerase